MLQPLRTYIHFCGNVTCVYAWLSHTIAKFPLIYVYIWGKVDTNPSHSHSKSLSFLFFCAFSKTPSVLVRSSNKKKMSEWIQIVSDKVKMSIFNSCYALSAVCIYIQTIILISSHYSCYSYPFTCAFLLLLLLLMMMVLWWCVDVTQYIRFSKSFPRPKTKRRKKKHFLMLLVCENKKRRIERAWAREWVSEWEEVLGKSIKKWHERKKCWDI